MKNRLRDSRRRISWAKNDFAQFKRAGRRFFNTHPHTAVREMDDKGIYELQKVKLTRPLPEALTRRTVRIVEELRSALDLAAYAVAVAADIPHDKVHFPFCASAADLKSRIKSACKDFPQEIQTLFADFKPHQGGDDLLWALNELCNASKHRLIVPICMATGPLDIHHFETAAPHYIPLGEWDSEKDELVIAAVTPGAHVKYKMQFSFDVTFGEVDVVKGKPVEAVLDALLSKVAGIVNATEAEAKRIGLF